MNWHQKAAHSRYHRFLGRKAHIKANDYIGTGKAICGRTGFTVYVAEDADLASAENNVCWPCRQAKERADELAYKAAIRASALAECAKYPAVNTSIAGEDKWADDWRDEARGIGRGT